jgi:hypothetical protein
MPTGVLSPKTCYDYRHYADDYVRPILGDRRVRDVTAEVILAWQRKLAKEGGTKRKKRKDGKLLPGKPLAPNTIRLARSSLAGAFKLAATTGLGLPASASPARVHEGGLSLTLLWSFRLRWPIPSSSNSTGHGRRPPFQRQWAIPSRI